MEFYYKKFKSVRRLSQHSTVEFCRMASISRTTLWQWEKGERTPSEEMVHYMASLLNIKVNEISDLTPLVERSSEDFGPLVSAFMQSANQGMSEKKHVFSKISEQIKELEINYENTNIVVKAIIDAFESILYVKNAKQEYIIVNKAFLTNFSLHQSFNVLGKLDKDFFSVNEAKLNSQQDNIVIKTGMPLKHVEQYLPGSRKKKVALVSKMPIYDRKGNILGLVGVFVDITTRKKKEQMLKMLQQNINSMQDTITIFNGNDFIYLNEAALSAYPDSDGKELKSYKDYWLNNIVHEDDREREIKYMKNNNWPVIDKYKTVMPNGKIKWYEVVRSDTEYLKKKYVISTGRDVTDNVNMNSRNETLIDVLNKSSDTFIIIETKNSEDKFYFSGGIEKLSGYAMEKFNNREMLFIDLVHPDDKYFVMNAEELKKNAKLELINAKPKRFRIVHASGETKWVESKLFYSKKNNVTMVGTVLRDVTNIVQIEKDIVKITQDSIAEKLKSEGVAKEIISKVLEK